ncbi:MAG: TIGR04283 family arsenosugar biosynthesis glycosyltransferase [Desulfuromonadales bacterium]|nr:TIGR04283 family arsenosugar biosynthesis glycosyltransferase [Desulfuromonadales bacterium]
MFPELSIIIPTLNESETLPRLLSDLALQAGVDFEVLVSDGDSTDDTRDAAAAALASHRLAGQVLTGASGRGRQLNRGAARAQGEWLLFLHADSRLPEPTALAGGLAALYSEKSHRLAGRFVLRFDRPDAKRNFGYYLCEVKARLDLPGTIHGDQGFLLPKTFFCELGGFREDLPVMEDTLLAEAVRAAGKWRQLPATIVTSPRRFESEGYVERQTLSALLMNFAMTGWDEPLRRTPEIYRAQSRTRPLLLAPFIRMIDSCLGELPFRERARIWYRTGGYVRGNAWQLMLRHIARRAFDKALPPEDVPLEPVLRFRRRFDALTDHPPGHFTAALLTWIWFRTLRRKAVRGE